MNIVNKEGWLGSPANIKEANKGPVHTNPFCICNRMGPRAIKD